MNQEEVENLFFKMIHGIHEIPVCVYVQVKRSFGLCSLQLTYFDEENEEVKFLN